MKSFLSVEERSDLLNRHRKEKDGRTRDRMKAVLLSDGGWSYRDISRALFLDEETISQHVQEYQDQKKLTIQTGGSESKLNPSQTVELIAHLEKMTYLKVSEICEFVQETYGIVYTVSGMTSWLKNHEFSYKKPKPTPAKADSEKQEAFIQEYKHLRETTPEEEPILFGDGVHPTMATKITGGWIRKGTDKPILTTASRTRMNLMGAIHLKTLKTVIRSYETLDSEAMVSYFQDLREAYPEAPKIHLILDQGPYNKSQKTQEAAKNQGIQIHYLPTYSPNLNPIERLWKVMNEWVRNNRYFAKAPEFRKAIQDFFEVTWPQIAASMAGRIHDNFQKLKPLI